MDTVQFGRWMSERRRKSGFDSQRSLVERAQNDPVSGPLGITKDFLARLEAGKFAHPFRGIARRRVLALAWLLCKTPRDVQTYLRAAQLTGLHSSEVEQLHLLHEHLATRRTGRVLPLLPRPMRLIGRETIAQELVHTLCTMNTGFYAITGMPGVGKSALASEILHLLATNEQERLRLFPDGIAAFTCTGRRGSSGLLSLLDDIITVFASHAPAGLEDDSERGLSTHARCAALQVSDADLARVLDRVRLVLASKRVLILLDDLDAQFPLRQALDTLLGVNQYDITRGGDGEIRRAHRVVLSTSRYIFSHASVNHHLHLNPLEPEAALEFLTTLIGHTLHGEELHDAKQVCTSVGCLPLAIEGAAAAYTIAGISLSLLAALASERPLDDLLDGTHELRSRLACAFEPFSPQVQQRFALLSTLGVPVFGLETAAAIGFRAGCHPFASLRAGSECNEGSHIHDIQCVSKHFETARGNVTTHDTVDIPIERLMSTASDLGQLVRYSLIDLVQPDLPVIASQQSNTFKGGNVRYRLHPLTYAQSINALGQLEPEHVWEARCSVQAYALAFVERYADEIGYLERERDFLFAALARAFHAEQYADVCGFVEALAPLAGRLSGPRDGESLFSWGIQASLKLHDRYRQARFLSDLGWMYSERGEFSRARQVWEESLETATSLRQPPDPVLVWKPLANLAHIAHIHGECDVALRYTEMYLEHCQDSGCAIRTADTLLTHAFYKRILGDLDGAYNSAVSAMKLFSEHNPMQVCSLAGVVRLRIEVELARVQGDYAESQASIVKAASLLQEKHHFYLLADLLFDQACFARQEGRYDDSRHLAQRVVEVSGQVKIQHFYKRGIQLLQQ